MPQSGLALGEWRRVGSLGVYSVEDDSVLTLRPKYRKLHSLNSKPKPSSTEVCFGTAGRMHPTETPQTLKNPAI